MFYESISQTLILLFLVVMIIFMIASANYQKKKEKEYKNDERWKVIQIKTNQIVKRYYELLTCLIIVAYSIIVMIFDIEVTISLEEALQYAFYVLLLRVPVQYFALRYFDKAL